MELGLKGKKVFITGATQGIGLATVKAFLQEGGTVYLNGHNAPKLQAVCKWRSVSLFRRYDVGCGCGKAM